MAVYVLIAMARAHAFVPGLNALRPALIIAGISLVLALGALKGARSFRHLRHPLGLLMLAFVVWAVLGAPFALVKSTAVMFLLDNFFRTGVLVVLLALTVRNVWDVRRLLMILAIGGMIFAYFGVLPNVGLKSGGGGGYDPNDTAMFLALTLPLIVYFVIEERRLFLKILFALAVVLCTIAIVRTGSRGGFLAFGAVVVYLVFFFSNVKPILRFVTVGAVVGVMAFAATGEYWESMRTITDPDDYNYTSLGGRKEIWKRARGYMLDNPVLGAGIANFPAIEGRSDAALQRFEEGRGFKWSTAHSQWYQAGVELGFPGLAFFAAMFGFGIRYLRRIISEARRVPHDPVLREAAGLASALIGSLIAIIVAGSFLSQAYSPMVWGVFGLILGLLKVMRLHGLDGANSARQQPVASRHRRISRGPQLRPAVPVAGR